MFTKEEIWAAVLQMGLDGDDKPGEEELAKSKDEFFKLLDDVKANGIPEKQPEDAVASEEKAAEDEGGEKEEGAE